MPIGRLGATLAVVVVATFGLTASVTGGHPKQTVTVTSLPIPATPAGPGALISVSATQVEAISPIAGRILRRVDLARPLAQGPDAHVGVSPAGATAYVDEWLGGRAACPSRILAIDTRTGAEHVAVVGGSLPAVDPSGTYLAYVSGSGSALLGQAPSCSGAVNVLDLRTGAGRRWMLHGQPGGSIDSLSWGARPGELVIGDANLGSGIQILHTEEPSGRDNPTDIGPPLVYQPDTIVFPGYESPVQETGGEILALHPRCWGAMSCPAMPHPEATTPIVSVDRSSGSPRVLATFHGAGPASLLLGPSGAHLIVETFGPTGRAAAFALQEGGTAGGFRRIRNVIGPVAWARTAPDRVTPAPSRSKGRLMTRPVLDQITVRSGGSIKGLVVLTNETGKVIRVGGCISVFSVLLTNASHPGEPAWPLCLHTFTFRPGASRQNIEIFARATACGTNQPGIPACGRVGVPPLPPGGYLATVYESGAGLPVPAPVAVRVTP